MPNLKITKQLVDDMVLTGSQEFIWDTTVTGFGVRMAKNGDRTYVVQYRTPGGRRGQTRRVKIGRHGSPWTPDTARTEARRILSEVGLGADPALAKREARAVLTVAELCDRYLKEGVGTKRASTLATDRGRIERHIKPLLGKQKITEITQGDIRKFLQGVARGDTAANVKTKARGRAIVTGGPGTASRTLGLLGGIFSFAVESELVMTNPTHGVKRFPDKKNERFLSANDIGKVGVVLKEMKAEVSCCRFRGQAVKLT